MSFSFNSCGGVLTGDWRFYKYFQKIFSFIERIIILLQDQQYFQYKENEETNKSFIDNEQVYWRYFQVFHSLQSFIENKKFVFLLFTIYQFESFCVNIWNIFAVKKTLTFYVIPEAWLGL